MKEYLILVFIIMVTFSTTAQQRVRSEAKLLFEAEAGLAIYDEIDAPPLSSFQLRFGSVAHPFLSMGLLLNGFTATGTSVMQNSLGTSSSYLTHGGRGGPFVRFSGNESSHFYAELQGTAGGIFQVVGRDNTLPISEDFEYGGGINIGYHIAFANSSYFGFYAGAEFGKWYQADAKYLRYNFGLRFQVRH